MSLLEQSGIYRAAYVRRFTPLHIEIRRALELATPRFGPYPRVAFF